MSVPKLTVATRALMDHIKDGLITEVSISNKEIVDPKAITVIKKRFETKAKKLFKDRVSSLTEETVNFLTNVLMQDMLGLGEIEYILNDENLEEREFEQLIERSGAGSHMVFRSKNDDEEFFIDEL